MWWNRKGDILDETVSATVEERNGPERSAGQSENTFRTTRLMRIDIVTSHDVCSTGKHALAS